MADNNKLVRTPFGDGQILEFMTNEPLIEGGEALDLSLLLDPCSFNPDGGNGPTGYRRFQNSSTLASINQYTVFGASPIRSQLFSEKFAFQWSLILTQEQWVILEAIIRGQQLSVQTRQSAGTVSVVLKDMRQVLVEPTPRQRATSSSTAPPNITAPVGYEVFFPKFNVLLSVDSEQITWLMDKTATETLVLVEMVGLELDFISSDNDTDDEIVVVP